MVYCGNRVKPVFPLSKEMINSGHSSIDTLNAWLWRIKWKMLVAVSGTKFNEVEIFIDLLTQKHRFELVNHTDRNAGEILDCITRNYQHGTVMKGDSLELFNVLEKSLI